MAISIHALREEGDRNPPANGKIAPAISIHALREEGDPAPSGTAAAPMRFLSTPSARRATLEIEQTPAESGISIHALREEGDMETETVKSFGENFYPRPPRGGRRGGVIRAAVSD